ncbi:GspH/FimT family protein [Ectothiorhodospira shaposhnikovii]|uniref:GspH/FimT family protein n=1 Tax=Ectothiorhodospira shaposhnikovii TaxID=1054 RepID=UPI001EE805FF|nr:GspH/FimT family pseudopilin [Ectothiorhodospira shaposhnikovii]MCG5512354.1 GspH/FimT family pseudopilin [Ectothiorhodospira shaposhnikovii]
MSREYGLTLTELLITLAVAAVLATLAIPGFAGMVREQQLITTTNTFISALHTARWEAVKRGRHALLCPSTDGQQCTDTSYAEGWIVGVVEHPVTGPVIQPATVIRHFGPVPASVTIHTNGTMGEYIAYRNDGQTRRLNGALQMGSVWLCHGETGRRIVISRTGRARVEITSC